MKQQQPVHPPQPMTVAELKQQLDAIGAAIALETERERAEQLAAVERARLEREAERQARIDAAKVVVKDVTKKAVDAILRLDAGAMVELDAAVQDLGRAGGALPADTAAVYRLRRDVNDMIARLAAIDPVLVGRPAAPSAEALAIREARDQLARAEKRLDNLSKATNRGIMWQTRLDEARDTVRLCQERLTALTGETFVAAKLSAAAARAARYFDPVPSVPAEV